jgi:hypothetical protein
MPCLYGTEWSVTAISAVIHIMGNYLLTPKRERKNLQTGVEKFDR